MEKRKHETDTSDDEGPAPLDPTDIIDVNFEFFNLKEIDFHAIKTFTKTLLENTPFNSSELADLVIAQSEKVGTTIKVDDSEPYGFISVINLNKHKVRICIYLN
jgi:protein BCP1